MSCPSFPSSSRVAPRGAVPVLALLALACSGLAGTNARAANATLQSPGRGSAGRPAVVTSSSPTPAAPKEEARPHPRFTSEVQAFVENFKPGGHDLTGQITLLPPQESLKRLRPADGYVVELAAQEPVITQPIDLRFDARGRLWVVQYRQYPFPAGMTVTSYDQYLRTEFDRISPPPPNHYRGADKITILEDTDGDGVYDRHKD
ncbi:MAG: hypothetical protein RIQ93_2146, partial [Verrucomicrobiota bacterium]